MAGLYEPSHRMPPNAAYEDTSSRNGPAPPKGSDNKPTRPMSAVQQSYESMTVIFGSLPPEATTLDIYNSLKPLAVLSIDILEDKNGERTGNARVRLVPPKLDYWYDRVWTLHLPGPPTRAVRVGAYIDDRGYRRDHGERIQTPSRRSIFAQSSFDLDTVWQGFMHQKRVMMVMDDAKASSLRKDKAYTNLQINFSRRVLTILVDRYLEGSRTPGRSQPVLFQYRILVRFAWIKSMHEQRLRDGRTCVVFALDAPPEYWRKSRDVSKTHDQDKLSWGGMEQWVRMAFLTTAYPEIREAAVSLHGIFRETRAVDIGRWTTFGMVIPECNISQWKDMSRSLREYNIRMKTYPDFQFLPRDDRNMWACLERDEFSMTSLSLPAAESIAAAILPGARHFHLSQRLTFEVAYQLEVCVSHGILHEHSLDIVFLESLAALTASQATRILEYVAERGKRIYQPHTIFRDPKAASYWRKTSPESSLDSERAVYVRKAIITPTTIVYSTPALDAGNRVLRHYREHHDRFLRVQFTDELPMGRLSGGPNTRRTDECFTRAYRALKNGIVVGGRQFQFLAFGNSQLRENSAYFFAPTELLTCQEIRDWMGDFSSIKTIAKYAARLGQCLSTTRPVPTFGVPTTVQHIPDVENGQFCFTDGVGKISKWWARVIATHLRVDDVPSAFQFRMGGSKGVLTVWPDVSSGQVVQIRPSQEKFPTAERANMLEIVRCSETATATLNQQTILLLSSLGVPSPVFMDLLHEELTGINEVIKNPQKAALHLMTRIDQNHTTPMMADMVKAGFMESNEPFVWALLHLWRSWSLKALKEKARITVKKSAFVLGVVDETDTLRGHINPPGEEGSAESASVQRLPQIFLQVPDLKGSQDRFPTYMTRRAGGLYKTGASGGNVHRENYKAITGLCLVGRNPSLHPGDLRVVEAVDVPELHHLRDVVVFPRKGDRDIPSMCSGGDLDGDDYFVFWDQRLLPPQRFWNYEAMDYEATREPDVDMVTTRHLTAFFVQHMKHDTLPRIAVAHRGYADQLEVGALHTRCLELAQLHSQAVDYAKTGVPALMPERLSPKAWPHWMEKRNARSYKSKMAVGQIYDAVQVDNFDPAYDKPFDSRVLNYFPDLEMDLLRRARRIKTMYDLAVRRAMAQKEIDSEFELWSGFCIKRPRVGTDYKVAEDVGRLYNVIRSRFRRLCLKEAGSSSRDMGQLERFVAAMYQVTHEEIRIAWHELIQSCNRVRSRDRAFGRHRQIRYRLGNRTAPLISFPWLFMRELSNIAKASDVIANGTAATDGKDSLLDEVAPEAASEAAQGPLPGQQMHGGLYTMKPLSPEELKKMEYSVLNGVPTHHGTPLDVSAYDGTLEDDDDVIQDEEAFEPMWTLPPGKSTSDIVIALAEPTTEQPSDALEGDYADSDYQNIFGSRFGGDRTTRPDGDAPAANDAPAATAISFPWAEMDDDVLSTTSEESLGGDDRKVILKVDEEEDDEKAGDKQTAMSTEATDLPEGLMKKPKNKHDNQDDEVVVNIEREDEGEDDIFAAVERLLGDDSRQRGYAAPAPAHAQVLSDLSSLTFTGPTAGQSTTAAGDNESRENNENNENNAEDDQLYGLDMFAALQMGNEDGDKKAAELATSGSEAGNDMMFSASKQPPAAVQLGP